jgi:hypothetical protein
MWLEKLDSYLTAASIIIVVSIVYGALRKSTHLGVARYNCSVHDSVHLVNTKVS